MAHRLDEMEDESLLSSSDFISKANDLIKDGAPAEEVRQYIERGLECAETASDFVDLAEVPVL